LSDTTAGQHEDGGLIRAVKDNKKGAEKRLFVLTRIVVQTTENAT